MSKDTSLFMAYARGELTFAEYLAAEDAVDPVTAADTSAVVPAPLWWLDTCKRMQAWRERQVQMKQSELRSAA